MTFRRRHKGLVPGLILIAALGAGGCAHRGGERAPGSFPPSPGLSPSAPEPEGAAPPRLVLDLGTRADRDLLPLVDGPPEGRRYEVLHEGPGWVLRAGEEVEGLRPGEIRAVDSGLLSRRALLELGELDGADLRERDLSGSPGDSELRILRFEDFERLVLRFGPGMEEGLAAGLALALDRESLAARFLELGARPAGACLPGEPDRGRRVGPIPPAPGEIVLLVEETPPFLRAAAAWIGAAWERSGAAVTVRPLPRATLRDRLTTGRFEAALLTLTREAPGTSEALSALARAGWLCADPPAIAADSEASLERWLRETCRFHPLLSLDRVVGLRKGLGGVEFDGLGRIDWSRARIEEEP